jgi:hypothetical protein
LILDCLDDLVVLVLCVLDAGLVVLDANTRSRSSRNLQAMGESGNASYSSITMSTVNRPKIRNVLWYGYMLPAWTILLNM